MAIVTMSGNLFTNINGSLKRTYQRNPWPGCSAYTVPANLYSLNEPSGNWVAQDYSKESRLRPLSLLDSLTSRPYIESVRRSYSRSTRGPMANCSWCIDCTEWYYHNIGSVYPSIPRTHWETKMRLKIKNEAVNLAESLYEWRQTANMFTMAAKGVKVAWDIYRGKHLRNRRLSPCDVASSELVFSFGLVPLLGTLHDSYWALQERLANPLFRRFEVSAYDETTMTGTKGQNTSYPAWDSAPYRSKWFRRQKAVVYVFFKTEPSSFTMGNPLELAYELIPFSWLVDGLVQIGDWLSSLDALTNVESLKGTLSTKDRKTCIYDGCASSAYKLKRPGNEVISAYQRDVITSVPYGYPSAKPSKSVKKVMHAVSALVLMQKGCHGPTPWWGKPKTIFTNSPSGV